MIYRHNGSAWCLSSRLEAGKGAEPGQRILRSRQSGEENVNGEKSENKSAVILSGGGANGAFEVGVMKALFAGKSPTTDRRPLEPDIYTGASVGSYNAAYMVERSGTSAGKPSRNWRISGSIELVVPQPSVAMVSSGFVAPFWIFSTPPVSSNSRSNPGDNCLPIVCF